MGTIPHLRELFGCEAGLSDHTLGVGAACAAVALGATLIEKHFTLSRAEGGALTRENLRIIRPGFGLAPKYYDTVLGMRVNRALRRGTPLSWEDLL